MTDPMQTEREAVTAEQLRELLHYDQNTGLFTWRANAANGKKGGKVAGHSNKQGYIQIYVLQRVYRAHRLAWLYAHGEWPKDVIDHINGKPSDNRLCNLRDVTPTINAQNRRNGALKRNITGVLGVNYRPEYGKYVGSIVRNHVTYHLGLFQTIAEAEAKRLEAEAAFEQDPHAAAIAYQGLIRGRRKNNTLGASFHHGIWQARLWVDGRAKFLGSFPTQAEAHQAFLQARAIRDAAKGVCNV